MADPVPSRTLRDYFASLPDGAGAGVVDQSLVIQTDFATSTQAVPSGGITGEVLGKLTDADYATGWVAAGQGTVQTVSVASANGFSGTSDGDSGNPKITLGTTLTSGQIPVSDGTGFVSAPITGTGSIVLSSAPTLVAPDLGTPSYIDLANATGLPRYPQKVVAVASVATLTPDVDAADIAAVTAQAATLAIATPSGTPIDGQRLIVRLRDNGVSRTLIWSSAYVPFSAGQLPVSTTVGKTIYAVFMYNLAATTWELVGGTVAGLWG